MMSNLESAPTQAGLQHAHQVKQARPNLRLQRIWLQIELSHRAVYDEQFIIGNEAQRYRDGHQSGAWRRHDTKALGLKTLM